MEGLKLIQSCQQNPLRRIWNWPKKSPKRGILAKTEGFNLIPTKNHKKRVEPSSNTFERFWTFWLLTVIRTMEITEKVGHSPQNRLHYNYYSQIRIKNFAFWLPFRIINVRVLDILVFI